MEYDFRKTERDAQAEWREGKAFEANPDARQKFFATFPYPYMSGPLHLGHAFSVLRVDMLARYKRLCGFNVLFPFAFHATGEPIVGMAKRVKARDEKALAILRESGVPEQDFEKFENAEHIVNHYVEKARRDLQELGLSVDWRREFVTTDGNYKRFIEWQYGKLRAGGYVGKGTHPVIYCPRDASPAGDHDRLEGEGVSPLEFTLLKFKCGDALLACATLRPETLFGVTNVWLNPDADYVKAKVNGETWVVSKEAAKKLAEQLKSVEVLEAFKGNKLIGKTCKHPLSGAELPILQATFVDENVATGVVMSVPAHAPYDYAALRDLKSDVKPISIIAIPGFGDYPAKEVVEKLGVMDQNDKKCGEATEIVYKKEFHAGVLKENCGGYAGKKIAEVKKEIVADLRSQRVADSMLETESRVVCRCGTRCIVKILQNQWFLRYSDEAWKRSAKECLGAMRILPEAARANFEYTLSWLEDKACARKSGLGTLLPWDTEWIIEALSDSTIYMAYYTIAHLIKDKQLKSDEFEAIFGSGGSSLRKEFEYWYPVDMRNSGKDLIFNHLTFFIFHHAALFERRFWPRAIAVNGFMNVAGEKMSKSRGNFITLRQALDAYGVDATRLNLLYAAEALDDPNWTNESAASMQAWIVRFFSYLGETTGAAQLGALQPIDKWLLSRMQAHVADAAKRYENMENRSAVQAAFFDALNDLRWYLRRIDAERSARRGTIAAVAKYCIERIAIACSPAIPHVCGDMLKRLSAKQEWPAVEGNRIDAAAELSEGTVKATHEDIANIMKITGAKPAKIRLFIADEWKRELLALAQQERNFERCMKRAMQSDAIKLHAKDAARVLQAFMKNAGALKQVPAEQERAALGAASAFLKAEFGAEVAVLAEADALPAHAKKAANAMPGKPAILLE